jgi:quinol monooxygenase YgiN
MRLQYVRKVGGLARLRRAARLFVREPFGRLQAGGPGGIAQVIVRVLTARVRAGRVAQFNAAMRKLLPIMREQPGLVYLKLARRLEADGGEEVILFEEWRDPDSVYAWAGNDLSRTRLLPAAYDAAEQITVTHYEALDIGLEDEPSAEVLAATEIRERGT